MTSWKVVYTHGWGAPEKLALCSSGSLSSTEFNRRYGQAGDIWALALLIGSLLKGGFHYFPGYDHPLPNFGFIIKRINITPEGRLDESDLVTLKQEEIDEELDKLVATYESPSTELEARIKKFWIVVKNMLTVDPAKRSLIC